MCYLPQVGPQEDLVLCEGSTICFSDLLFFPFLCIIFLARFAGQMAMNPRSSWTMEIMLMTLGKGEDEGRERW